jgi:2-octaprenyl-6-methoxyphenol hydroxylase
MTDIVVAGGGPAGLVAACLIAKAGRTVALIAAPTDGDPRTVALMQPSLRILEGLGVWPGTLMAGAAALLRLRLVDDTGSIFPAPTITFDAAEIGEAAFGWNIPLALLLPALRARAVELGVAAIAAEVLAAGPAGDGIAVETSAGTLAARAAVAADGRNSLLREAAGISCERWSYDQAAIATSFTHSADHDGVSTEYHRAAGPFTTVPMPGRRSSLVWMERPARAAELMSLADHALAIEIQLASHGDLGLVSAVGPRKVFAMQGLVVQNFAANRIYLVGEAAHVVPPIGAQGLNMSLHDAALAASLIAGAGDPGASDVLADYDRERRADIAPRRIAIDLMNRSLLSDHFLFGAGRALGLAALAQFGPLRRLAMRRGLGPPPAMPAHGTRPTPMA